MILRNMKMTNMKAMMLQVMFPRTIVVGLDSSSSSDFLEVVQNFFPIHFQFSKSANSVTEATS